MDDDLEKKHRHKNDLGSVIFKPIFVTKLYQLMDRCVTIW